MELFCESNVLFFSFQTQLISSLKLQLSCAAGNAKADLELEMEKNKAFSTRITSLGL